MRVRIIYLAAGNSRRFYLGEKEERKRSARSEGNDAKKAGFEIEHEKNREKDHTLKEACHRNKLLHEIDGKPMWKHVYEKLARIVLRHESWELVVVARLPEILGEVHGERIYATDSPESINGVSCSIRAGICADVGNLTKIDASEELGSAYAFFVADQPQLTEESAEHFLEEMEQSGARLGSVKCGTEVGNPTWFLSEYQEELLALEGDRGGRKVLAAHEELVHYFEVADEKELEDRDYM